LFANCDDPGPVATVGTRLVLVASGEHFDIRQNANTGVDYESALPMANAKRLMFGDYGMMPREELIRRNMQGSLIPGVRPALTHLLSPACSVPPALSHLLSPTCSLPPALSHLLFPTFETWKMSEDNLLPPAVKYSYVSKK
jgi:hypothetical protein